MTHNHTMPAIGATSNAVTAEDMRCPKCRGRGVVPLPPRLQRALGFLREHGPSTVNQLHRALGPLASSGPTNTNNWLTTLETLGLAKRSEERVRGSIVWTATTAKATTPKETTPKELR